MSLSRAAIVDQLKEIVGADRVITDETVLKKNSIDRFRKFPDIHGIYTLPIPAAVVKLGSTEQVSRVLNFMNAHKITVCRVPALPPLKVGWKPLWKTRWCSTAPP